MTDTLEGLLREAICPHCSNTGAVEGATVAVCCRRPDPHGNCCNQPIPEQTQEQCQWCANRDALLATGGWIKVSERLPEDHEVVIVKGGIGYIRKGVWYSLTGLEYPGRPIQWIVTAWQPLPKENT